MTKGGPLFVALGAAVLAAGCQIDLPGYDAGTSAGADATTGAGSQTVGDQCTIIVTEFCMQASSRCIVDAFTDCVAQLTPACCVGTACNATSKSSATTVAACTSAIDSEDCNFVAQSMLPAACQGVPQTP